MKKILITGIGGLIGKSLVNELTRNFEVYGITRRKLGYELDSFHELIVDLSKGLNTSELPEEIDAVIYLAQSEHFREFPNYAQEVFSVNTMGTLQLLDYARQVGAKTFISASSGGIYGYGEKEFLEDVDFLSKGGRLGFYLGTKLCSEILAESYTSFMNVMILRFFFVYGPGQKDGMLMPRLIDSVVTGKAVTLQGGDGLKINPIYVTDAVSAIIQSLELQDSHKINVAGAEILNLRQMCNTIGQVVGQEPVFETHPDETPHHLIGDIQKMTKLLGAPNVTFEEGIRNISSLD